MYTSYDAKDYEQNIIELIAKNAELETVLDKLAEAEDVQTLLAEYGEVNVQDLLNKYF